MQEVTFKIAVNFNINKETANELYKSVGTDYQDIIVNPAILESIKSITAQYTAEELITSNILNNNSLVMKLSYNSFSMLFTGDIEKIAEEEIVNKYIRTNKLNTKIIKIAHHGSKTSSIQEFLNLAKPRITLIGVGANNNFGHPNEDVLKRLEDLRL